MDHRKNTKIVATLGPMSSSEAVIEKLITAGADIFRLNFSHGTHEDHQQSFEIIRRLEQKVGRPITILMDLQGPKLRIGKFKDGGTDLQANQTFRLELKERVGNSTNITLPHPEIFAALASGTELLLDDGKIRLKVESCGADFAETKVLVPGYLSDHKGLNVPGVQLPLSVLTTKDRHDLKFGLQLGVDCVALSFVQKPEDVAEARSIIKGRAKIVSKIEKPAAIDQLEEIIALSDAVMVARGDLGVEVAPEEVPGIQKRIIRFCRLAGKPVIVATQMLESMIDNPTPTRAEASDVATAVYEGADAVMLSAESASGNWPVESVAMMTRIINQVEQDECYRAALTTNAANPESTAADAITFAASHVAQTIAAKAIVTFTTLGSTTLRASRARPSVPILALTSAIETARFLNLVWGTSPVVISDVVDFFHFSEETSRVTKTKGFAQSGDKVIVTAGVPDSLAGKTNIFAPGTTNLLRILKVS